MFGRSELAFVLVLLAAAPASAAPLVVLDPGHGGTRTGAKNGEGNLEKDVVLSVARYTRKFLEKSGIRVVMTRDSDVHHSLRFRSALANRKEADVFVSLHANWSPVSARRGSESYILSAEVSDRDVAALLHMEEEEEADAETLSKEDEAEEEDIDFILADLRRANVHKESARLARQMQDALGGVPPLMPSRGLRQAPFAVLRRAKMPAVLVELGYLSHAKQGKDLVKKRTHKAAGRAVARAIVRFLKER